MRKINFAAVEKKWQKKWEKEKVFESKENGGKNKYYVLEMFPYPSGAGLHIGHAFNYTIGDIQARFMRMKGFNVLYPMGYDSFGLPAENAAIKEKVHPRKFTDASVKNFIKQQKTLGLSYDWSRMFKTSDPEYYKWNQYFFLKFLEKDLAYRKKSNVNWCPKCNTVLANEQVHNGKCWRHGDSDVVDKALEQWFIKTTKYADELLEKVDKLDWPERIKAMQRNWIGKSKGVEINFDVNGKDWKVFTTRADTLFGVTFLVISSNHSELMEVISEDKKKEVEKFLKKLKTAVKQEDIDKLEKEGVFTGSYAKHPLTGEDIPIWAGNFVVADYGSGMVMAVPAHDQRDFEFAKKYNIPIKVVVSEDRGKTKGSLKKAYTDYGFLVNSEGFDGLKSSEAKEHVVNALKIKKKGKKTVNYKLRDWLVSRQRYWGTPIPIVYCDDCGIVPVPYKELPVILPEKVEFGKGNPLESNEKFLNVKCYKCGKKARRETDTMDTFFDSSWYYLRYCDSSNDKEPFDKKKVESWMNVDRYIGGAEHACMHLIYARFFTKALRDLGFLKFDEPFESLFNQGTIHGEDGNRMSKSIGNTIDPLDVSSKHNVDSLRLFIVSVAGPDKDFNWSSKGIEGSSKFVKKLVDYFERVKVGKSSKRVQSKTNKTIANITRDIENVKYNLAVIKLRNLLNDFEEEVSKEDLNSFLKMFSLICPHISEELWEKIGNKGFISLAKWPEVDKKKIDDKLELMEKSVEKTASDVENIVKIVKEKQGKEVSKVFIYVLPNELKSFDESVLSTKIGKEVRVFAVNDKNKYDPEGKSKKVKPGRPGIYVE